MNQEPKKISLNPVRSLVQWFLDNKQLQSKNVDEGRAETGLKYLA